MLTGVLMYLCQNSGFYQLNFFGKPGFVVTPKSMTNESRANVSFKISYMPYAYEINNFKN